MEKKYKDRFFSKKDDEEEIEDEIEDGEKTPKTFSDLFTTE